LKVADVAGCNSEAEPQGSRGALDAAVEFAGIILAALTWEIVVLASVPLVLEAVNGRVDRLATFNVRHLAEAARELGRSMAESDGVALNQLINVAVAEKLWALRTDDYFGERSSRADIGEGCIAR
jgi:hypothetical protein